MIHHFRDGRWRKGQGSVPLDDRLWRFGDGFFESVRVEDGVPRLWPLHAQRMQRSLKALGLPPFDEPIFPLPKLTGVYALRIHLSGGLGGGLAQRSGLHVYASLSPYHAKPVTSLRAVSYVRTERPFGDVKMPVYVEAIVALRKKRVDDLIACDKRGFVLESASGNVFAHVAGRWVTPSLDGRVLPGTTRAVLLRWAEERPLKLADLRRARAVVLTSALREVATLTHLDGKRLKSDTALTRALYESFRSAR